MRKQHALLRSMDNKLFLHLLVVFTALLLGVSASTCGYEACPPGKSDMLNVHIICHTHDDVGWLHTVDTYYDMWVKDIINSVISNLMQDENRKFIYVESAFFSMWWEQQTDLVREYVTRLVNDGRLEFISGGWSMNDEATTHYLAIIDQMTLGLRWLNDTFGSCASPKVGWQIDTFGHSKEQASLFAQMYFDGQFIGRIHYQDKIWRQNTKTMEFVWHASESLGEKADLFTGVLPNVYWPPKGFCFDSFCADEELSEYNIDTKSQKFITIAEDQAKRYASKHIVMTMGMDFQYRDAAKWYRNLDMLISHINSLQAVGIKVNMFYSTPTCYLHSLHQANITWPTMKTDFFPYASKQHEYWTGYFTSRPSLKYYVRKSNSFFQVCKQLVALSNLHDADILTLYKALGVVQHHDGITGTEKQHVANDYVKQLSNGIGLCEDAVQEALKKFIFTNETTLNRTFDSQNIFFCHSLNISQCDFTEQENEFFVLVYNSLGHSLNTFIRFPVTGEGYEVRHVSESTSLISAQVIPIPPAVLSLPERASLAVNELVFPATLSPLGLSVYSIQVLDNFVPVNDMESGRLPASIQDAVIENEHLQVVIDGYSGLMKEIIVLATNTTVPVKQSFYYYEGMPGYRLERASGAYAFNPQFDLAFSLSANITYRIFKGSLVEEVHQYYTSWISQVIRLYRGQNHVEFDWVVGPIPVHDNIGREIITRFDTNLETNGTFFTDCNGRETLKRVRNNQTTWPWNITEQVAGNYYPVNSWIYIQDETKGLQLSILTDRAQGGSSISDGSIELMVNRRLLFDDGFGVSEALNEPGHDGRGLIVRGTHYLTIGPINDILNKYLAKKIFHTPMISFIKQNYTSALETSLNEFYGLNQQLPPNVHLLTLERLDSHRILLRLEHFYEKDDDPELSNPVTFSIANLFTPFRVVYYQETTLSANKYLYEVERLKWSFADQQVNSESSYSQELNSEINTGQEVNGEINGEHFNSTTEELRDIFNEDAELTDILSDNNDTSLNIILRPMEIRTFIVKVEHETEV